MHAPVATAESPAFDLGWVILGPLLVTGLGLLCVPFPSLLVPLWWAWILLLDGPHLVSTWQRVYPDPQARARFGADGALLWFLPGFAALGLSRMLGVPIVWQGFLGLCALGSWHHLVRQHWGIYALLSRRAGADRRALEPDRRALHATLWAQFLLFLIGHPKNRELLGFPEALGGLLEGVAQIGWIAVGVALVVWGARFFGRIRGGERPWPALFVFVVQLASFVSYRVIGAFEPLYPGATDPEHFFLAVAFVNGAFHGIQYMGLLSAVNRRRYQGRGPWGVPWLAYALFVSTSLLYFPLNALRNGSPSLGWSDPDGLPAGLFLATFWGLFVHHYMLDARLWKVGSDAELRFELGLQEK